MNRFPKFTTNPSLNAFIYLTLVVAAVLIAIIVLGFVLKIIVFAAIVAALALGILFVVNLFRRRRLKLPVGRQF